MDGTFDPMYSSNNIWYDTNLNECITTHVEEIETDIAALQTLVGETGVATQISTAISTITPSSIGAVSSSDISNVILSKVYPVGSIYMSVNNISPASFLGGTWEVFAKGRTLVGVDTSQTEFNSVRKTGGEKAHALTASEMPAHEGHMYNNSNTTGYVERNGDTNSYFINSHIAKDYGFEKYDNRPYKLISGNEFVMQGFSRGGNISHNNLQPYITCYMWRRTR